MKYLKISIGSDGSTMIYPDKYQEEIGKFAIDHLYYEDGIYYKLLLCFVDKDFQKTMIRTNAEEITETEAKAISEANEARIETIKDEVKLRRLELKARLGNIFSQEELDCLDPQNPTSIFGVSKILADKIIDLKAKEIK